MFRAIGWKLRASFGFILGILAPQAGSTILPHHNFLNCDKAFVLDCILLVGSPITVTQLDQVSCELAAPHLSPVGGSSCM